MVLEIAYPHTYPGLFCPNNTHTVTRSALHLTKMGSFCNKTVIVKGDYSSTLTFLTAVAPSSS